MAKIYCSELTNRDGEIVSNKTKKSASEVVSGIFEKLPAPVRSFVDSFITPVFQLIMRWKIVLQIWTLIFGVRYMLEHLDPTNEFMLNWELPAWAITTVVFFVLRFFGGLLNKHQRGKYHLAKITRGETYVLFFWGIAFCGYLAQKYFGYDQADLKPLFLLSIYVTAGWFGSEFLKEKLYDNYPNPLERLKVLYKDLRS